MIKKKLRRCFINKIDKRVRTNSHIIANEVRLIDSDGAMLGITPLHKALSMARLKNMDLVEIAPEAAPPVCKIMDFAKFRYEEKKKAVEAKKKQKTLEIKEIKLKPRICVNDLNIKIKQMTQFINDKHHVKVTLIYRGREAMHKENGIKIFEKICESLAEIAKPEAEPKILGNTLHMKLVPLVKI